MELTAEETTLMTTAAETLANGTQYTAGKITVDELVERTRARYGLL